jgi:hypothetical protein
MGWLRWEETTVRAGRVRERNALPDCDGAVFEALDFSIGGFNEGCTHASCSKGCSDAPSIYLSSFTCFAPPGLEHVMNLR